MFQFLSKPRDGYCIDYGRHHVESSGPRHVFCGRGVAHPAACPNCSTPLLLFLRLDTTDERIECRELRVDLLPLLFCWKCNISQEPFYYRVLPEGVEIVRCGVGGVNADFPYEAYPLAFPESAARLLPLTADEQQAIVTRNCGDADECDLEDVEPEPTLPRHQLGGEPYLVQADRESTVRCADCRQPMPFLASIADDNLDPRGFTGNPFVQVLYYLCRPCSVVCAIQQCD